MADVLWVKALFPTKIGLDHITFFPDTVCFREESNLIFSSVA